MYNYLQRDISEFAKENPKSGNLCIDWTLYGNVLDELIDNMRHGDFHYVYGLPRGGLIPAVSMSHLLKSFWSHKPMLIINIDDFLQSSILQGVNILLIDDILDTGKQMKKLIEKLKAKFGDEIDIKTCSIVYNERKSEIEPDYYGFANENGGWIDFPWECVK